MDIGKKLAELEKRLARVEGSPRLSHAALDNANIVVKDEIGVVKGRIGMQEDGTIGLIAVDGPPPGAPNAPVVTPSISGLRVVWDGTLADGSPLPSDFDHIAVHVSTTSGFTPSAATFVGTITRSGDGGTLPVTPLPYQQHYVQLTAVNSSGIAGPPSAETAGTPVQVEGPDLTAGSVTAGTIAAGAVTADKLEAILQLVTRLVAGNPAGARVELNEDGLRVYNADNELMIRFDSADGDAVFTGTITGSTITGGMIQTAETGQRITLNEQGANEIIVYDATGTPIGELSPQGLLVKGTGGGVLWMDPNAALPSLRFVNPSDTNSAYIQVAETTPGDANIQHFTGTFAGDGFTDRSWRLYMGNDFAVLERIRRSVVSYRGGRVNLRADFAEIGYMDSETPTDAGYHLYQPGVVSTKGRHLVEPQAASADSALHVTAQSAHTGNLLRLFRDSEKFAVDKDGHVTVAGRVKPATGETGTLTLQSGWTNYDATNYGTAQVRKTADGLAYLVGRIQAGTATNGTLIATLPNSSYWPQVRHPFPHRAPQGGVDVTVLVSETGEIRIYDISGTVTNLALAGIFWPLF